MTTILHAVVIHAPALCVQNPGHNDLKPRLLADAWRDVISVAPYAIFATRLKSCTVAPTPGAAGARPAQRRWNLTRRHQRDSRGMRVGRGRRVGQHADAQVQSRTCSTARIKKVIEPARRLIPDSIYFRGLDGLVDEVDRHRHAFGWRKDVDRATANAPAAGVGGRTVGAALARCWSAASDTRAATSDDYFHGSQDYELHSASAVTEPHHIVAQLRFFERCIFQQTFQNIPRCDDPEGMRFSVCHGNIF